MCRKFIYFFFFVFVLGLSAPFCTMVKADIAISTQANWWPQADADREMAEIAANVTDVSVELFTSAQHAALAAWVTAHTNNGQPDLLILCGIFPDSIYPAGNAQPEGSIAELFLDAGNVIINTGDYMFYVGSAGNNDAGGLYNMMDITMDMWDDDTPVVVTADGQLYTPTLQNFATDRPWHFDQLTGNWSAELVLAQNAAGTRADPAIVVNSVTGGRLGTFYQIASELTTVRGEVISEWINNWYLKYVADLSIARDPDPADGAVDVPVDTNLSWTRGLYAIQDQVYFGTDPVMANLPLIVTLSSIQPALVDFPQDLVASTTYYWYVVETDANLVPHPPTEPWSFTTVIGEANPLYPTDGSMIIGDNYPPNPPHTHIYTPLDFTPGQTTVSFTGYFSDVYADVAGRAQDANLGPPPYPTMPNRYYVGLPLVPPAIDSLVRGTLYYWTVDSKDARGNEFPGDIWEFTILGYYAFAPYPPNEAVLIPTDVLLSWKEGAQVNEHDIYMGTSWEDVNNARYNELGDPQPPEFLATRTEPNIMVTGLPPETKQYWRVDEIYGRYPPPIGGGTYYIGPVWCFTTIPYFPIIDPNLVGWWKFDMGFGPTAWDSSGHENHGTLMGNPQWVTAGMFGGAIELDGIDDYVDFGIPQGWPSGLSARSMSGWGKTNTLAGGWRWIAAYGAPATSQAMFIGINGDDLYGGGYGDDILLADFWDVDVWHHICLTYDGTTARLYADGVEVASMAKTWNLVLSRAHLGRQVNNAAEFWDGQIDDVQIYDYALSEAEIRMLGAPPEAWLPSPADSEAGVVSPVTLKWMPGKYADKHDVYVSTDKALVNARDISAFKGRIDPNTYGPIILAPATVYYWAIDEVNDLGPDPDFWPGSTWMFRAAGGAGGLQGLYYHWDGSLPNDPLGPDNPFQIFVMSRIDPTIDFPQAGHYWATTADSPDPNINVDDFACRWVGHVECPVDANYTFYTTTDDGARLFIDGQELPLVRVSDGAILPTYAWRQQGPTEYSASVILSAGLHDIEMHMYERAGGAFAQLRWSAIPTNPADDPIPRQIIPSMWLWPPLFATGPNPPHLATIDDRKPALEFLPGLYAVTHELYFSASYNDVNDRNPLVRQILIDPCRPWPIAAPLLELGRTYYWCVDEVKSVTERWNARTVWEFTIAECLSLDNFEDYNDRSELRKVWRDGNADVVWGGTYPFLYLVQGGSSGSNLNVSSAVGGYDAAGAPSTGPVRPTPLNYEAMVLRYDNDGFTYTGLPGEERWRYDAPYFSEIEANTVAVTNSLDVGTTWSSEGIKSVSMWFQGHPISDGFYDATNWPEYTITGRGRDIWGRHDEFYFLSQYPLTSPGTIQVQVYDMENTNPWAKAGVMIREKWTPYSKYAAVFMTPGNGVTFQWRQTEDGPGSSINKTGVTVPQYVKLERTVSGNFIAKHSSNGMIWYDVNDPGETPQQPLISMGTEDPNLYIGTAVTSHDGLATCTADFNNVLAAPSPTNWIFGNIGTNDPEQLYVALSDGTNTAVVDHPDPNAVTLTDWQEWNIELTDFGGINLNNITKVYIGLGDRDNHPDPGGSGAVYVDDFRACPPRCVAAYAKPQADIAVPYDCVVDEKDLAVLAGDWLMKDYVASPLLGWYRFEGDGTDSSVYGHDANVIGDPNYVVAGKIGQSIQLDGTDDHLIVGSVGISGDSRRTIAGWAKADVPSSEISDWTNVFGFTNSLTSGQGGRSFDIEIVGTTTSPGSTTSGYFGIHVYGWEYDIMANDQDWHHFAATYDGTTISWYGDGILVGSAEYLGLNTVDNVQMGKRGDNANYFPGQLDDVRIYDKSLTLSEIQSIMDGSLGTITDHHPIDSPADLYQGEAPGNQWINLKDYGVLANQYLDEILWP